MEGWSIGGAQYFNTPVRQFFAAIHFFASSNDMK